MCLTICLTAKKSFSTIKTSIFKSRKIAFFQRRSSVVLVKNLKISHRFVRENGHDILQSKKCFLDNKNINSKKP